MYLGDWPTDSMTWGAPAKHVQGGVDGTSLTRLLKPFGTTVPSIILHPADRRFWAS